MAHNDAITIEASIDTTASDTTLVTGVAGKRTRVWQMFFVQSLDSNVTFKSGSTALTGALSLTAFGTLMLPFSTHPWFTTGLGEDFVLNQSASAQISGRIYYSQG